MGHRFNDLINGREPSASNHETEDDDDELMEDGDDLRVKLFGHLSNGHHRGNSHLTKDGNSLKEEDSTQVYYYRSRLCYYLPRLFYLTLVILILYVVFWLFCAVPSALYGRIARQPLSDSNLAIIASGDGKRKKVSALLLPMFQMHFTYFVFCLYAVFLHQECPLLCAEQQTQLDHLASASIPWRG